MSNSMFCFQCEQVAGGKACTRVGACGKQPATSNLQDDLTVKLIELAMFMEGEEMTDHAAELMMEGLFTTITNVNFNDDDIKELTGLIQNQIDQLKPQNSGCGSCCGAGQADITRGEELFHGDADEVALRTLLLLGLRGMAAYAYHAYVLGRKDPEVTEALFRGMREVGTHHRVDAWLKILNQFGLDNYRCMELLDEANTGAYGHPVPTPVTMTI